MIANRKKPNAWSRNNLGKGSDSLLHSLLQSSTVEEKEGFTLRRGGRNSNGREGRGESSMGAVGGKKRNSRERSCSKGGE